MRDVRYQHSSDGVPTDHYHELSCVAQPAPSELCYLCVVTDVTDRVRTEQDRLRSASRI